MLIYCICAVMCIFNVDAAALLKEKEYRLDLIHYNDFHARFEETSVSSPICHSNASCLGGFARLYEAVQMIRAKKPDAILLNAGDNFQGTYWYTLLKWNVTQHFMNMLPHEAYAIGNHEFDDGISGLVPYLKALKAPVVAANLNTTSEPSLNDFYKPSVVVERNKRKIGIIGVTTTETANTSSAGKVIFNDPKTAAELEARKLTDQGIKIIILLSHCGLPVDKQIAMDYGENIDIIIGGHSHSLLWNGTSPSGEKVEGPYPVVVESKANPKHKVLIVTAAAFSKYIGDITISFDENGEWTTFEANPLFLNKEIPESKQVKALLAPYAEQLHSIVSVVIGEATDDFLVNTCGQRECALGNLAADSLLEAAKTANVSKLPSVAFVVRNSLRGNIVKGDITRGDIINTVPFSSKVQTFALKGEYLWQTFEHCLTNAWQQMPFNGPWMPQVAGMKVSLDTSKTAQHRVISVLVQEENEYKPLDMNMDYQVTVYSFLALGGDGFKVLKDNLKNSRTLGIDADILEKHIKGLKTVKPSLEGRLTILNK